MKLKKIASLMLAGVMAVSMLAGCKSGTGSDTTPGDDDTVVVPETGIAAAFNNGQSKNNKANVKFTDSDNLTANLASVVKDLGDGVDNDDVADRLKAYNGIAVWNKDSEQLADNFYNVEANDADDHTGLIITDTSYGIADKKDTNNDTKIKSPKKVDPLTRMYVVVVDSSKNWTEENAVKDAASQIDKQLAELNNNSLKKSGGKYTVTDGDKYYTYSYTGEAAMVSEVNGNGTTSYYFAIVVTQNVTQVEYEA